MNERNLINRLSDIAIQLSNEQDVDKLLQIILESCIEITNSDAGSIYTAENNELNFEYTVNNSVDFPFKKFVMPINNRSIAGNCALNKKTYNLKAMSDVKVLFDIEHNESFDRSINYKTMNMLVVPLQNYEGDIIGVMQLINKKEEGSDIILSSETTDQLPTYTELDEQVTSSLASQAAILIDRSRLHVELSNLLDSMISTLSTTLERRDPVTSGHSKKVAEYSIKLAEAVNASQNMFNEMFFDSDRIKELEIAALLHDVGKIGISEAVLQKRHRLTDANIREIVYRFHLISTCISNCNLSHFQEEFNDNTQVFIDRIISINEADFIDDDSVLFLTRLKNEASVKYKEMIIPFITDMEYKNLIVVKGNLTEDERYAINMHAKHSQEILEKINWGRKFSNVPRLASHHHEKLNGKGYPFGLNDNELTIMERILAIADIYDALTARDRPYKPALSVEKARQILGFEVENGALDGNLVELFVSLEM